MGISPLTLPPPPPPTLLPILSLPGLFGQWLLSSPRALPLSGPVGPQPHDSPSQGSGNSVPFSCPYRQKGDNGFPSG